MGVGAVDVSTKETTLMFSFPKQSMCGLSLALRTQVTEIFALGREGAECSLKMCQPVKQEILDKQLSRDPIS